jgi:secreted trypsin-like serine protease
MQRVSLLKAGILPVLALAMGVSGALAAEDTEMIVGGTPAPDGKYPWQVRLYNSMDDVKGGCGGSLIGDQWVLTAGHCAVVDHEKTENLEPLESIVVGYGSTDRTKTTKIESDAIFVHPDYLARGFDSKADVALIRLKEPVPNAPFIPLIDRDLEKRIAAPGAKVTITGWGAIWDPEDKDVMTLLSELTPPNSLSESVNFPLKLQQVDVEIVDPAACATALAQLKIGESEICVIKPGTQKNSCYGDSGGPLVVPADNPRGYAQVGVVSWGVRCGREIVPNVFARVSAFHDWIETTMKDNAPASAAVNPPAAAEPGPVAEPAPGGTPAPGGGPVTIEIYPGEKPKPAE